MRVYTKALLILRLLVLEKLRVIEFCAVANIKREFRWATDNQCRC